MGDLKSPKLIVAKGILFLLTGLIASSLLLIDNMSLSTLFLLVVAIWSSCRAYYFAFYVLEKYVDPNLRYSGLYSLFVNSLFVNLTRNQTSN